MNAFVTGGSRGIGRSIVLKLVGEGCGCAFTYVGNKEAAYDFLTWATSAEVQKEYAKAGGIPVRKSVFTDPELVEQFPYFPAAAEAYEVPPIVLPRTPEYVPLITMWGQHLNAMVAGIETIEEGLAKAEAEMTMHLKEAGYYDE